MALDSNYYCTDEIALNSRLDNLEKLIAIMEELPNQSGETMTPRGYVSRPWTPIEDQMLIDYMPIKVPSYIAMKLKRTLRAVLDRYRHLTKERTLRD